MLVSPVNGLSQTDRCSGHYYQDLTVAGQEFSRICTMTWYESIVGCKLVMGMQWRMCLKCFLLIDFCACGCVVFLKKWSFFQFKCIQWQISCLAGWYNVILLSDTDCVGLSDSVPLDGSKIVFLLCFCIAEEEISQLNALEGWSCSPAL